MVHACFKLKFCTIILNPHSVCFTNKTIFAQAVYHLMYIPTICQKWRAKNLISMESYVPRLQVSTLYQERGVRHCRKERTRFRIYRKILRFQQRFQISADSAKDFKISAKISAKISDFVRISAEISRFHMISGEISRFQDPFQISAEISW